MARRMISTAVQLKGAPTEEQIRIATLHGNGLQPYVPTEEEVRDALARVTRDLEDMRVARAAGGTPWEPEEGGFAFNVVALPDGSCALRGTLIIRRAD